MHSVGHARVKRILQHRKLGFRQLAKAGKTDGVPPHKRFPILA